MCIQIERNIFYPCIPEQVLPILSFLPAKDLLQWKSTCTNYRDLIKNDPTCQVRISEFYLLHKPSPENIDLSSIYYSVKEAQFTLQITQSYNIKKLTENMYLIIPWVTKLIIKTCEEIEPLETLLKLLGESKRLQELVLLNTDLKDSTFKLLKKLSKKRTKVFSDYREKKFAFIKEIKLEESQDLLPVCPTEEEKKTFSTFCAQNESLGPNNYIELLNCLGSYSQMQIISCIWYAKVMPPDTQCLKPLNDIIQMTRMHISKNPNDYAVIYAFKKYLSPVSPSF